MDPAFVKKEAKWYEASKHYDILSRLPPESLSESNPRFKEATHDFYYKSTKKGLETRVLADHGHEAWPAIQQPAKRKKRQPTPEDSDSDSNELKNAGIPPKDRQAFNAELRRYMEEYCPEELEGVPELPNPISTKASKAEKAQKAVISREKRAAAKARSTMPPAPHTRNTRLRAAQAAQAAAEPDNQAPNGNATATQNATAAVAAPEAEDDPGRSRQHSAPPFNLFMRDTRATMDRNAFMSRPVHGVVSDGYYAALNTFNDIYRKPRSVGDEPIGNDIPRSPADAHEPATGKLDEATTIAPKETAAHKKSTAQKPATSKAPAPKKSAAPKPAAPKPAASKPAAPKPAAPKPAAPKKSAATKVATSKAASTKPVNSNPGKDKPAAVKLPRAAKACDPCRSHKTRCTGGTPCDACRRRGFTCVYAPEGRKAPVKRAREDSQDVVKKEPLDKDAEQEGRPAKRARKLEATSTKEDLANGSDNMPGTANTQLSSVLPNIEEVPSDNDPDGSKASKKRAHEDDQEAVEKQPLNKDAEQEGRPAKRARKLEATSTKEDLANGSDDMPGTANNTQLSSILPDIAETPSDNDPDGSKASKKRAREDDQEAGEKQPLNKDAEQESRPAKRVRKIKIILTNKKSANKKSTNEPAAQLSSILPSIEEIPEDSEEANVQLSKIQRSDQPKIGENAAVQPTEMQSSYSGRITRSRSRQLSEEVEAQTAKLQSKGKRAREDTGELQERPAKLQRSSRKGPNWRKPDGNPELLRAIDSMRVDSEGRAITDEPWDNYPFDPTWMSNTYLKWENSFGWPDLNLRTQEESFHARPSIKLVMTDVLKGILVDDWEHVTKDSQLVPLPHEQPVVKILNDYLEDEMPKREEDSAQVDILKETMAGLREYFDRALGRILLYRFERLQYSELLPQWENEKDGGPSSVYGGEHLCRLLVSLPELLAQTNMDQQSVSRLREELTKFTNWLSKNGQKYFVREYEVPGPEYQDKAKSS